MNKRKLIQRIIVLPAMMIVYFIPVVVLYFKYLKSFFLYGGEMVTYFQKNEVESVQQLYYRLKDETGESQPVYGRDLEFISKVLRTGKYLAPLTEPEVRFLNDERFFLKALSLSEGTFIAHGFNSYIVKRKKEVHPKEITVIIEKTKTGFSAYSKDFELNNHKIVGLNSVGSDLPDVKSNFYEVISGHLQYLKDEGIYDPELTDLNINFIEQ